MNALAAALVLAAVVDGTGAMRVRARPEIPWVTAVVPAIDAGAESSCTTSTPEVRALLDAGGAFQTKPLLEVGGPPEAEALVVAAARACGRGPLFLEGRTPRMDAGVLPRPALPRAAAPASKGTPSSGSGSGSGARHRLAADPGLLDVEGAALELFVEETLAPLGPVTATVVDDGGFALVVDAPAVPAEQARALLEAAVSSPLVNGRVEKLRAKARGEVAARRAAVGGWARDAARMWLLTGRIDADEPADLGTRLRARVFPALLFPTS